MTCTTYVSPKLCWANVVLNSLCVQRPSKSESFVQGSASLFTIENDSQLTIWFNR